MTITYLGTTASATNKSLSQSLTTLSFTAAEGELILLWAVGDNVDVGQVTRWDRVSEGIPAYAGNGWLEHSLSPVILAGQVSCYLVWTVVTVPASAVVLVDLFDVAQVARAMLAQRFSSDIGWGDGQETDIFTSGASMMTSGGTFSLDATPFDPGDLLVGGVGVEGLVASITGDADTLDGSWSTVDKVGTTGGSAATNVSIGMQYKVVTGTSTQTWDPGTGGTNAAGFLVGLKERASLSGLRSRSHYTLGR